MKRQGDWIYLGVIPLVVFILDLASKWWIVTQVMNPPRVLEITSFFNIILTHNYGVSFSFLYSKAAWHRWVLVALSSVIVGFLIWWRDQFDGPLSRPAIGMILGGAVGNILDRIWNGAVTDFLDFHWETLHFAAFNVADMAISGGVMLLLIDTLRHYKQWPK